jgi:hypothetical protein
MKAILNSKTKTAQDIIARSCALTPADMPQEPTVAFQRAETALRDALKQSGFDILDYGYDACSCKWYARVEAPKFAESLSDGSRACPFWVKGEISAVGGTPAKCIEDAIQRYNDALDWISKVTRLLAADKLTA